MTKLIITKTVQDTPVFLVAHRLGDVPEFQWSANRSDAQPIEKDNVRAVLRATQAYGPGAKAIDERGNVVVVAGS